MTAILFAVAAHVLVVGTPQAARPQPAIIFVCEHGAAKSLIATAYFNKLAAERGLPYRATFRGVVPQADLSQRTVEGLRADGIVVPTQKLAAIADNGVQCRPLGRATVGALAADGPRSDGERRLVARARKRSSARA